MVNQTTQEDKKSDQPVTDAELAKLNITRVPMDDHFQCGKYKYSSLEYAIAQSKRDLANQTTQQDEKSDQPVTDADLAKLNITRVPMDDRFQCGKYQYSSLEYAIAQSKREKASSDR
jgi:S-ribosylhomocysteine lyase LuxS involved in autoinducer biosynthesis